MAEGRWLPWKEQKMDIRPSPDYKRLAMPLKAPPHGLAWRRLQDGAWELRKIKQAGLVEQEEEDKKEQAQNEENTHVPEFLEHVVMPDDTLTGICLRYKVTDRELRRLNDFVGPHFRLCETLVVPNRVPAGKHQQKGIAQQVQTRQMLLQRFRNASHLGDEEAKYYLQNNEWNLNKALDEWRAETKWEFDQDSKESHPATSQHPQQSGLTRRPLRTRQEKASKDESERFSVVSGTKLRSDYFVSEDGTIEMGQASDLADARIPLLSAQGRG